MHLIPEALRARMLANDRNLPNDIDPSPSSSSLHPAAPQHGSSPNSTQMIRTALSDSATPAVP